MKNRVLSILLTFVLLMSLGTIAFASSDVVYESASASSENVIVDFQPARSTVNSEAESEAIEDVDIHTFDGEVLSDLDKSNGVEFDRSAASTSNSKSKAAQTFYEFNFSGTLASEGDFTYVYPIDLYPGEVIQSKLIAPNSTALDYYIYLCEVDSLGNVAVVDECNYATDSTYMSEQVGSVNTSSGIKTYAVFVESYSGFSTTIPFGLNITLSEAGSFDAFETDENAFTAKPLGTISGNGFTIERNLNCPIDNEFYYFNVPANADYNSLKILNLPGSVTVENYRVQNGRHMVKVGETTASNDTVSVSPGYNYLRIIYNGGAIFNPLTTGSYNITIKQNSGSGTIDPPVIPGEVAYTKTFIIVNGHCQRFSTLFPDKVSRGLLLENTQTKVRVEFYDKNDNPVNTTDTIWVGFYNPKYDGLGETAAWRQGEVTVTNASFAEITVKQNFRRTGTGYDDIYCWVESDNRGYLNGYQQKNMALIAKYDNGELNQNCAHGATCPYK